MKKWEKEEERKERVRGKEEDRKEGRERVREGESEDTRNGNREGRQGRNKINEEGGELKENIVSKMPGISMFSYKNQSCHSW